jgi:hypothetical protein
LLTTFWSGAGSGEQGDWFAFADGFFSASEAAFAKTTWKGDGKPIPDAKLIAPLNDPAKVAKAAQGEKLPEPLFPK